MHFLVSYWRKLLLVPKFPKSEVGCGSQRCLAMWPNIQGDVWNVPAQNKDYAENGLSVSGCFNKGRSETVGYVNEYADGIDGFVFNASKANATYGGNTVQSPAIQALACIKI